MKDPDSSRDEGVRWSRLAGVGFELAAAVCGMCLAGYWIDLKFGTDPWALLIGAGLGITGGLYNLIRKALLDSMRQSGPGRTGRGKRPPDGTDP